MKKIFIFFIIFVFSLNSSAYANADNQCQCAKTVDTVQKIDYIVVKNKLFAIEVPAVLKGTYQINKYKDALFIYHKKSRKENFGGFAFGIKAYKNPEDHADIPGSKKIGELSDKKGVLYDMVIEYPTDVQFDYTQTSDAPKDYMLLYDLGAKVNVYGVNGSTYYKNQGMKGEFLYEEVLKKHVTAIKEKWDSTKLEKENMSYMYNVIGQKNKNLLDKIGYQYEDINGDGIEELLIGEITDGAWKGITYDMYTMVDRKPAHVVSGGSRNRYFVCDNGFVSNEYSSGAKENGLRIYYLTENSTELFPQLSIKYDGYKNSKNPYFISYGNGAGGDKWTNVSEKKYNERKQAFSKYRRYDFVPLSKFSANN